MNRKTETIQSDYFDKLYRSTADPWSFKTSRYEKDKYQATLECLLQERYASALEVGCSIGVFTSLLAPRCGKLLAIDASQTALKNAAESYGGTANTEFRHQIIPAQFPAGPFDLTIFSEVLYYLDEADLKETAALCMKALNNNAEVILCHWLGETDYPLTGLEASEMFAGGVAMKLPHRVILHDEVYRLERLTTRSLV